MNKRRESVHKRCSVCKINHTLCFCSVIEKLPTQSRISIIMHHREKHLSSNTARLAALVLPNCQLHMRGLLNSPFSFTDLAIKDDETPLFLFPHNDADILDESFVKQRPSAKFHLIVPDGTWSQAVKTYRRTAGMKGIPCVKISPGIHGQYKLRKTPHEFKLSTFEAIYHALAILENSPELGVKMEKIFVTMVERFIKSRTSYDNISTKDKKLQILD